MSTLQKFLIKSAGLEKEARTAIAKRLLASTMTPQEVVKRFGKVKGNRYLDDITTAVKNYVNALPAAGKDNGNTRTYLRSILSNDALRQLHFNNKLSKSDYLKHIASDPQVSNSISKYNDLMRTAGSQSGLSDLYSTLPRQDKLTVSKYLRGAVPESGLQQLPNDVRQSAQTARDRLLNSGEAPALPNRSSYAQTLHRQYGIKSREELIKEMQANGIDFNPDALQHSQYITGPYSLLDSYPNIDKKHALLAATKLPYTSNDRLLAQEAALIDVLNTSGKFNSSYKGSNMDELPRSVQKALQIIKGENLLEPGTRANRLFNKVYNNKALYNKLGLTSNIQDAVNGKNAAYWSELDAILVHPKAFGAKNPAGIEAHERGHRAAHILAPDTHADEAFRTFRKMHLLGKKYNMDVPIEQPRLMREVFAESYIPKLLGPNSGAATFNSPRQYTRGTMESVLTDYPYIPQHMHKIVQRKILERYKDNMDAINTIRTSEDTKNLFRQLAFNYGHALV